MAPINGYKQCKNGSLIQARYWSDGIVDCTDASDERASTTPDERASTTPAPGESIEEKINRKFNTLVRELESKSNNENHFADLSQAIIEAFQMSSSKSNEDDSSSWSDWALKLLDLFADYALPNIIALCISGGTARRLNKKFATQKDAQNAQKDANKVGEDTLHQHQDEKGEDKATVNLLG